MKNNVISYEEFCAARKAKIEKNEIEQQKQDEEYIYNYNIAMLEYYEKKDSETD